MKRIEKLFIYFCVLHNLRFFNFEPYFRLGKFITFVDLIICIYFLCVFVKNFNFKIGGSQKAIVSLIAWIYIVFLTSILTGYLINGQSLYYGMIGLCPTFLNIGLFFYLYYRKVSERFVKNLLWRLAGGYVIASLLAYEYAWRRKSSFCIRRDVS